MQPNAVFSTNPFGKVSPVISSQYKDYTVVSYGKPITVSCPPSRWIQPTLEQPSYPKLFSFRMMKDYRSTLTTDVSWPAEYFRIFCVYFWLPPMLLCIRQCNSAVNLVLTKDHMTEVVISTCIVAFDFCYPLRFYMHFAYWQYLYIDSIWAYKSQDEYLIFFKFNCACLLAHFISPRGALMVFVGMTHRERGS